MLVYQRVYANSQLDRLAAFTELSVELSMDVGQNISMMSVVPKKNIGSSVLDGFLGLKSAAWSDSLMGDTPVSSNVGTVGTGNPYKHWGVN